MENSNKNLDNATPPGEKVGFPDVSKPVKKNLKNLIFILVPIILLAAGAYLFLSKIGKESATIDVTFSPTPFESNLSPTPTAEASESIDKTTIRIQILNGSGISGAASSLKKELEKLGYKVGNVGNAKEQNYTNTIAYMSNDLSQIASGEIITLLKSLYTQVDIEKETGNNYDIIIITGYTINYTPTPTEKLKPTTTLTPTQSPTPTI